MSEATRPDLPSGTYHIFSKASDFIVGRKLAEDKSLRPKGIFTLDPGVDRTHGRVVRFNTKHFRRQT